MKNVFEVTIRETRERTVRVEAVSREAAERIVRQGWQDSTYVLGDGDSVGVTIQYRKTPVSCSAR